MRRFIHSRWRIASILSVSGPMVLVVLLVGFGIRSKSEDHGKNLELHFVEFAIGKSDRESELAVRAFQLASDSAIPFLRLKLRNHNSLFRNLPAALWDRLPASIADRVDEPGFVKKARLSGYRIRLSGVKLLGEMGDPAQDAIPDLLRSIDDPSAELRLAAIKAIISIAPESRKSVVALCDLLFDSDRFVRLEAARAMPRFTNVPTEHITKTLISALEDREFYVRLEVLRSLAAVNFSSDLAQRGFVGRLGDPSVSVRRLATSILRRTSETNQTTINLLVSGIRDRENPYRPRFATTLYLMTGLEEHFNQALDLILLTVENSESLADYDCAVLLDYYPEIRQRVPEIPPRFLDLALACHDSRLRLHASNLLPLYPQATTHSGTIRKLINGLRSSDPGRRESAARAIADIGPVAEGTVPTLMTAISKENDGFARTEMILALGSIGQSARAAIPILSEQLKKSEGHELEAIKETLLSLAKSP